MDKKIYLFGTPHLDQFLRNLETACPSLSQLKWRDTGWRGVILQTTPSDACDGFSMAVDFFISSNDKEVDRLLPKVNALCFETSKSAAQKNEEEKSNLHGRERSKVLFDKMASELQSCGFVVTRVWNNGTMLTGHYESLPELTWQLQH